MEHQIILQNTLEAAWQGAQKMQAHTLKSAPVRKLLTSLLLKWRLRKLWKNSKQPKQVAITFTEKGINGYGDFSIIWWKNVIEATIDTDGLLVCFVDKKQFYAWIPLQACDVEKLKPFLAQILLDKFKSLI